MNPSELRDSAGRTLLHFVAEYGNKDFAKQLIDLGADVDAQDQNKQTPLMLAVKCNQRETARVLLEAGADLFVPDNAGRCALGKALDNSQDICENIVKSVLDKITVESLKSSRYVESAEFHRDCPVYYFIILNNAEVTRTLLERGSPVDAKMPFSENTALHLAVELDSLENVKLLLKYNANVNAKNAFGSTPFARIEPIFEESKTLEVVTILLSAGALLIDYTSRVNMISQFLTDGSREIVHTLLQCEVDLLFMDYKGLTSLHYLAKNSCPNILEELPSLDFDINVRCRDGLTMLQYAAQFKNPSSVKFLLDHGADVNVKCYRKRASLHYAAHPLFFDRFNSDPAAYLEDCVNCVEILLECGADPQTFVDGDVFWIEGPYPRYKISDAFLKRLTPVLAKVALREASSDNFVIDISMRKFIESFPRFKNTFDLIKRQLEEMKQIKIDDSMTLFEFLSVGDKKIARLARNEKFVSNLTELMKELSSIPYYLQRRFVKISRLSVLRKTYLPVINDVLGKYCNLSIGNVAEQIIDYLQKDAWKEIL